MISLKAPDDTREMQIHEFPRCVSGPKYQPVEASFIIKEYN